MNASGLAALKIMHAGFISSPSFHSIMASLPLSLPAKAPIAVAVSGGADSICLLHLLHEWCTQHQHPLLALTVNHGLRAEAENEAQQVSHWCKALEVEHQILNWEGDIPTSNIQAQAREIRYELMHKACQQRDIQQIFIAHHQQDQAETALIQLMRGTGITGLSAMRTISHYKELQLVRPLLELSKSSILETLEHKQQDFIHDPSNDNEAFLRVKARKFLTDIDRTAEVISHIARATQNFARSDDFIQQELQRHMAHILTIHPYGFALLHGHKLFPLHDELALRLLGNSISCINGSQSAVRIEELERAYHTLKNGHEQKLTLGGCFIQFGRKQQDQHTLYIIRETSRLAANQPAQPDGIYDKRFTYQSQYNSLQHHTIGALGHDGWQQVKKHIVVDYTLPTEVFYALPALKHLETIITVPHINFTHPDYDADFSSSFLG